MRIEKFGMGVFYIHDFLTPQECARHIGESEAIGYHAAGLTTSEGDRINRDYRTNDRIIYDNAALADQLYQRAAPELPPAQRDWTLSGFNERFRFYRYQGEQFFSAHKDGSYVRSGSEESFLTFLIYLNDDFTGGHTDFAWESIKPKAGSALVFPHRQMHQGSAVQSGTKYVLRTDVMYHAPAGYVPEMDQVC
ncbi:2OG-Fe(II) oxygenase [Massilia antarctica]|uniref:2OG-Fe(II) oxygenase n=1 Tax=Massilia antarctica TaxID=2765360 RepID=A0AA48WCA6_9BURK|nr:2OG-Fe(II) oxygenase [Massilia antarctica]QPI48879.1 2OG-Fe(II) oxygenase [Massilia antarctica]